MTMPRRRGARAVGAHRGDQADRASTPYVPQRHRDTFVKPGQKSVSSIVGRLIYETLRGKK